MTYPARHTQIKWALSLRNHAGNATIEFAFLLPLFLILGLGVLEFGADFLREEVINNAVSTVSMNLQHNPNYYSSMSTATLNSTIAGYDSEFVSFTLPGARTGNNYICVDAYKTQAQAEAAPICANTHFTTANPNGANSVAPYYVAVRSSLQKGTVTPFSNFIKAAKNVQINQTSGVVQLAAMPVKCTASGYALQWNATTNMFECNQIVPPNCSNPWNKLVYNTSTASFSCVNIPYIFTGNIEWPSTLNGGVWDQDNNYTYETGSGYRIRSFTLCKKGVTFSVPAMDAGYILLQGNLIYPSGYTGDIHWHSWTVSFSNTVLPNPSTGGKASMDVCMSHGGNWIALSTSPPGVTVQAEHVSWTATYIPTTNTQIPN